MFSPVSQISIPFSSFFSLPPPFISSFTPFHHFGGFLSNNLDSIESGVFNGLNQLQSLPSFLSSSIISSSISPFISLSSINLGYNSLTSLPSDVFNGLSSLSALFISSHFLFSISLSFIVLFFHIFILTVSPPFLQVFLKVLTIWLLFHFISLSFPPSFFIHLFFISL